MTVALAGPVLLRWECRDEAPAAGLPNAGMTSMLGKKATKPCFTVRKVVNGHWGLVYMGCPARSEDGQVLRFSTESEAEAMAQDLNERERRIVANSAASEPR
jgi:hypothetical protein